MKVLQHIGKWISFKLDQVAKLFITKPDLLDIALQEQEERINTLVNSIRDIKTSRKNLEDLQKKTDVGIKSSEKKISLFLKENKDDMAKIQIKFKLEQEKQVVVLVKQTEAMKKREKILAKTLEKLRDIFTLSKEKAEFYKATYAAAKSTIDAVDIDMNKKLDVSAIMKEIEDEVSTMDNKVEAIDEMKEEGIIKDDSDSIVADADVEAEFERLKAKK